LMLICTGLAGEIGEALCAGMLLTCFTEAVCRIREAYSLYWFYFSS
jgi:hypothetical protein